MKQIIQSLKDGEVKIENVPMPSVRPGHLLIQSSKTLISAGTEKMLIDFGKAGPISKARQQPDKVRMVVDKIKAEGFQSTFETVKSKLDQPIPLGYCNVGRVVDVGSGVHGFSVGDRVVSNGKHAEFVCVPKNLCVGVPALVSDDDAVFTVLYAIALQGIRLAAPALGETVAVIGLGLVGLAAVQLLKAQGCRVLGIDFDPAKAALAEQFGAESVDLSSGMDPVAAALKFSKGRGMDAVLIAASSQSSSPIHQAATISRKRGRIVLVGVTGLELSRADFYEKELTFQVSCSYGPGRYDASYEEDGIDYPFAFVRWTEQRNFEAVVDMIADKKIDPSLLKSHQFEMSDANKAYDLLNSADPSLGIVLNHNQTDAHDLNPPEPDGIAGLNIKSLQEAKPKEGSTEAVSVSFIGAGAYASKTLMPAFKAAGVNMRKVVSREGLTAAICANKFDFSSAVSRSDEVFSDCATNAVVITTRHDSHAELVLRGIEARKHIYVEKPLCIERAELNDLKNAFEQGSYSSILMVGFNRRFSPLSVALKKLLEMTSGPKSFVYNINAGHVPHDHWTQSRSVGGGRLIGEAVHFIDLLRFFVGEKIIDSSIINMNSSTRDTFSISLKFEDGSLAVINYFANGPRVLPKERLEIFASGRSLYLDNWRSLKGNNWPKFKKMNLWRQDKGQKQCVESFVSAIRNSSGAPIDIDEISEVMDVALDLASEVSLEID